MRLYWFRTGIDKRTLVSPLCSETKFHLPFPFCMEVLGTNPHYISKYQPILIVCCGEQQERRLKFAPSEGPEGLVLTSRYSRSMKKGAMGEILGSLRVLVLQSVP